MAYIDLRNRAPKVERLPDLRLRVTYQYDVLNYLAKSPDELLAEVWIDWGTADDKYPACRLIKQDVSGQLDQPINDPVKTPPQLVRIFEQIPATSEIQVGNATVSFDQSGRKTVSYDYLQFSAGTSIYQVVGTNTAASPHTDCVLKSESRTDDDTLQRIHREYINSGLINQSDETKNNGSLLIRTLTYINQVPPTPAGYVLFSQKVDYPAGLPVYTYSFAKGSGEISREIEYRRSVDSGTTGVTITTIKYLSASSVVTNPITPPASSATLISSYEDLDGYRIWTGQYGNGSGTVESSIDIRNHGKLYIYSLTSLNTPPSAPSPSIGGTITLVKQSQRNSPRLEEGAIVYDYIWIEGNGLIADIIQIRGDGLREETYISLGVRQAPSGKIINDESEEEDGLTKYTVRAMQSAAGSDPTGETLTLYRNVPFTYPGRAKAYTKVADNGWTMLDVFLSPPVEASIPGQIDISYSTSPTISVGTRWQPTDWATIEALWVTYGNLPQSHIEGTRGYRAINSGSAVSVTASDIGAMPGATCIGSPVYGGTTATVKVYGGPSAPDGNTYVLDASTEVAFQGTDGTIYYRHTTVSATIPSQAALPV